jgi:transcriptional regulator with XRE-family HTH domain
MKTTASPSAALALTLLRMRADLQKQQLAERVGVHRNTIAYYENGTIELSPETLEDLATAMGYSPGAGAMATFLVEALPERTDTPREQRAKGSPLELSEPEVRGIEKSAAALAKIAGTVGRRRLGRLLRRMRMARDRRDARALWTRLRGLRVEEMRAVVSASREFQSWALCELVCEESARAAADKATRALDLARLAVRIAESVEGEEGWRAGLQGYAWAFVSNAWRVAGDLIGAERSFRKSQELWETGGATASQVLDPSRLFDLEASLRRAQRRFGEALALLDRALAAGHGRRAARLLLSKSAVFEQMGDHEGAHEVLCQASGSIDKERDPRLRYVHRFNLGVTLCHLGRATEARWAVEQAREIALDQGNELDLVRVLWLEGKVAWGLGDHPRALELLRRVRREFVVVGVAYDAALVSLELSVLQLEIGRRDEVQDLTASLVEIFKSQGVHREALAALRVYLEAVRGDRLTLKLARRLLHYFELARHDCRQQFQDERAKS